MHKFSKWYGATILLGLFGLIIVLNLEDWARVSGELNKGILLTGIISTFLLVVSSIYCIFKANIEKNKYRVILSVFTSFIPLSLFVLNGLLFTVYFVGK